MSESVIVPLVECPRCRHGIPALVLDHAPGGGRYWAMLQHQQTTLDSGVLGDECFGPAVIVVETTPGDRLAWVELDVSGCNDKTKRDLHRVSEAAVAVYGYPRIPLE